MPPGRRGRLTGQYQDPRYSTADICGYEWAARYHQPPPPQFPDWACAPEWRSEFQDFVKETINNYAWNLATETEPIPETPVAKFLLGLRQMVQGLRDAWGPAGLNLPREVLDWTTECELRSLPPVALTTNASTQTPPPPRPRPTVARDASTNTPPPPPARKYVDVASQAKPSARPATSSPAASSASNAAKIGLRKTQEPVTDPPLSVRPATQPVPPDRKSALSDRPLGRHSDSEWISKIHQELHLAKSKPDSKVGGAIRAGLSPTFGFDIPKSQPKLVRFLPLAENEARQAVTQPEPLHVCHAPSLEEFAYKARQAAALFSTLPPPPPLTLPGPQTPPPSQAATQPEPVSVGYATALEEFAHKARQAAALFGTLPWPSSLAPPGPQIPPPPQPETQAEPVRIRRALPLEIFEYKARLAAILSGTLPWPPLLHVQTPCGPQIPPPSQPALTKPPLFGTGVGLSSLLVATLYKQRETIWVDMRNPYGQQRKRVMTRRRSSYCRRCIEGLLKGKIEGKGKGKTAEAAVQTEKPGTPDDPIRPPPTPPHTRTLRSPSPAPQPMVKTEGSGRGKFKECFQSRVGWMAVEGGRTESFEEKRLRDYGYIYTVDRPGAKKE